MSCEHLICAQCAGPVVEGRCTACRASRAQVHHRPGGLSLPIVAALVFTLLLVTLALRLAH
jgi:hypothetical protein